MDEWNSRSFVTTSPNTNIFEPRMQAAWKSRCEGSVPSVFSSLHLLVVKLNAYVSWLNLWLSSSNPPNTIIWSFQIHVEWPSRAGGTSPSTSTQDHELVTENVVIKWWTLSSLLFITSLIVKRQHVLIESTKLANHVPLITTKLIKLFGEYKKSIWSVVSTTNKVLQWTLIKRTVALVINVYFTTNRTFPNTPMKNN